jgi:glucose/arabinose dehydrogenase
MQPSHRFARVAAALLTFAVAASPATAAVVQSEEHSFRVVELVRGLEQPWSLAFLPDGRMLVTEKAGRLRVVRDGVLARLEPEGPATAAPDPTR